MLFYGILIAILNRLVTILIFIKRRIQMNFLKNINRKRNIKQLAYYNERTKYYKETINATQKCISDLEICLKRLLNYPNPTFVVMYSKDYTKELEKHREALSCARSKLEYWETLRNESLAQLK